MEGQVSGPGWLVARFAGEFWRAIKTRQSQLVARHDRDRAAMSNVAICICSGLGEAIIGDTCVQR